MAGKVQKFAAVIFLTLLIWTWAYLSVERQISLWVTIEVSPAAGPEYLVQFEGQSSFPVKLTFKGPPTKVSQIERRYRTAHMDPLQEKLIYYYMPQDYGHTSTGTYSLDLMDFIRQSPTARELALTLEACEPPRVTVNVEVLVPKQLVVQCVDENGSPLAAADVQPGQVQMYVRPDYTGPAYIRLTAQQIAAARQNPIRQRPYVDLGPTGPRRFADQEVRISLPTTELLNEYPFQPQSIGFIYSRTSTIPSRFRVQIENESDLRTIHIRATEEAYEAYRRMRYHLLIEIREEDAALGEIPPREVIFNFPREFVRKNQIEATAPKTAVIKLVPLTPSSTGG